MDYGWRRLTATEAASVERHLEGCAACRAVLAEEEALGASLKALPVVAPPRDLWETVRLRKMALDIPLPEDARRAQRLHPAIRGWTTAVAVGMAALALMLAPGRQPAREAQAPTGARVLAQTLDSARQITRQADDPLNDLADTTWDALSLPESPS